MPMWRRGAAAPALLRLQRGLDLDDELDLLAHHDAAGRQRHVGGDAPVCAVDLADGRQAGPGAAVGVRAEAVHLDGQLHRSGDALDGQLAVGDDDLAVPLLVPRVERGHGDGGGSRRLQRVVCGDDLALDLGEVPADLADHKVAGHEPDVRVDRVDVPGARDVAGDLDSFGRHSVSLDSGVAWLHYLPNAPKWCSVAPGRRRPGVASRLRTSDRLQRLQFSHDPPPLPPGPTGFVGSTITLPASCSPY